MVAGKRYFGAGATCDNDDEARRCQKAINQFFHLIGIFVPSDAFPILGFLDINGHEKAMKKTAKELDFILEGWLKEHREKRKCTSIEAKSTTDSAVQDFIDVMLSLEEEGRLSNFPYDADTSIKSTCLVCSRVQKSLILIIRDIFIKRLTWYMYRSKYFIYVIQILKHFFKKNHY